MIEGASTTWCQVTDMNRAIAFYRDCLGLTLLMESPYWTEFRLGEGKIALHHHIGDGEGPCGDQGRGWMLGLVCSDIRSLAGAVVASGGTQHGMHQTPGGVVLTISDPDGNPMQAMQVGAKLEELN